MVTPDSVKQGISSGLTCEHVEVMGDGQHFEAVIVSAAFDGKSALRTADVNSAIAVSMINLVVIPFYLQKWRQMLPPAASV